jgi:O-antigen ligase
MLLSVNTRTRRREYLFTAGAVTLLLFTSMLEGTVAVGLALGLVIVGLVLFPETRRVGIAVVLAAAVVAAALTFITR